MVSSPGQTVAGIPLLATKHYAPKWRPGLVSRPHLLARLDQGAERKLTLVSAPAGFGKTTLLAEWLATTPARKRATAWLSLDPGDNDPTRFWAYVIAGLQAIRPGVGATTLPLLQAPQPPPIASVVTTLINELAALEHDVVLILDDLHVLDAPPVHEGIAFLLEHLPPRLHLVVASRADPPVPLARLRGRGDLTEVRAADLRFTPAEAAAFLNGTMGLELAAGDVAALEGRTEGWIAGLQLAALSLRGRADVPGFIATFTGDDRYIVDYLVEEVLGRQPEPIRRFLLATAILDRLSGPLCDAVTGQDGGTDILRTLERSNLFVVPLDDKRQWYRYHHLFAAVLQAHALAEQPEQVAVRHRRAAAWFEEHGMAAEAIEHALAAGDHEVVARLLTAHFEEFVRLGRNASIARWAASLPDEMVRQRPRLALIFAASASASSNNNQTARRLISWAEEAINAIEDGGVFDPAGDVNGTVVGAEGLDALKGEMLVLKITLSARHLPAEELAALAGQARELLPPSKHRVRGMLHMVDAGIQMTRNDLTSGLPNLERSVEEARRAQHPALLAGVLAHRGRVYVAMGRLEDGRRSYEEAMLAGRAVSTEANLVMCVPHTGLAEVLLEHGDLAGSTAHAAQALDFASRSPTRSPVLYARTTAAQVMMAAGDISAAFERLAEAQEFVRGTSDARYASFLSSVTLKLYCRTGDLDAAADVVRERGLAPDVAVDDDNEEEMIAYARYLVARGDGGGAAHVLSRVLPIVRDRGRVQHEIHALALQALAYELVGERARALASLGRATMLGEPGRFNRTFTGEGLAMTGLLAVLADAVRRGRGPAQVGSPSYLADLLREVSVGPETVSAPSAAADLAEPLTAREVEILRLIAAGMRNKEIADQLFISLPTVKRHIANAYGKLGVTHRTEAVARAGQLNLL